MNRVFDRTHLFFCGLRRATAATLNMAAVSLGWFSVDGKAIAKAKHAFTTKYRMSLYGFVPCVPTLMYHDLKHV